jgi:hypothetical protein
MMARRQGLLDFGPPVATRISPGIGDERHHALEEIALFQRSRWANAPQYSDLRSNRPYIAEDGG